MQPTPAVRAGFATKKPLHLERLIAGACVASPREIAQNFLQVNVTDQLSLIRVHFVGDMSPA